MHYNTVICGGTFDRLHEGHKYFLRQIFSQGERVLIGLTSDTYAMSYKSGNILPFQERLEELKTFLAKEGLLIRAEIFPIQDVYGKALDPLLNIDAIVVSENTKKGAEEINKKREEMGLPSLPIVCISLQKTNGDTIISSTTIREGHTGRKGEIYLDDMWTKRTLVLPQELREILHKPFHTLLPAKIPQQLVKNPSIIVTVGDGVTKRFNAEKIGQALSVVDFAIERKSLFHSIEDIGFHGNEKIFAVTNPPGYLTPDVWDVLKNALEKSKKEKVVVRVKGEEDLLVIPLVLLLPLGWKLFYGQPKRGVVYLPITEEIKEKVYTFLIQFVPK